MNELEGIKKELDFLKSFIEIRSERDRLLAEKAKLIEWLEQKIIASDELRDLFLAKAKKEEEEHNYYKAKEHEDTAAFDRAGGNAYRQVLDLIKAQP